MKSEAAAAFYGSLFGIFVLAIGTKRCEGTKMAH